MNPGEAFLERRGITPETQEKFGLTYDTSKHAVRIPYLSATGDEVYTRWRLLSPNGAKYLQPKGSAPHIYNVVDSNRPHVYITEGEFDCLILKQAGYDAVGIPGAKMFGTRPAWKWLFQDCRVTIVFDGDDAGQAGASLVGRMIYAHVEDIDIVKLPAGYDVNDLWLAGKLGEVFA